MFEAFYASPAQHPWLLWVAVVGAGAYATMRLEPRSDARRFALALCVLSALDAWLTSAHVYGCGALPGHVATFVPLFFVLAGDFRYLLLITSAGPSGAIRPDARSVAKAAAGTLVVPLTSQIVVRALPGGASDARILYLVYELLFASLTLALIGFHPRVRALRWVRGVSRFVLVYYALWALADLCILAGSDLGFALRVVPNVLYYGGFVAAVAHCVARAKRETAGGRDSPPPPV